MSANDIREMFPGYRWAWTEDHEPGQRFDPYHVEITGRYGSVYLHRTTGGVELQAWTDRRGVMSRLEALPGVTVWQRGADEMTVRFAPRDAPAVMGLIRCHRKPPGSSPERLAEMRRKAGGASETDSNGDENGNLGAGTSGTTAG